MELATVAPKCQPLSAKGLKLRSQFLRGWLITMIFRFLRICLSQAKPVILHYVQSASELVFVELQFLADLVKAAWTAWSFCP